jgi:mannose-6-phosphate isomerase
VIVVRGALRDYAWGRYDGLAEWTPATDGPQAELWFGAHQGAPSPLADGGGDLLDRLSSEGLEIPLLVKLLAAARPLSLQVHPRGELAARWWGAAGHPLLADGREKAEMLIALDDFSALVGFRPAAEVGRLLAAVGLDGPATLALAGDLRAAVAAVLRLAPGERDAALAAMPAVVVSALPAPDAAAMAEVLADYPGDGGALVALCLQHRTLRPGDALYVPAGLVHGYVRGLGVEVMTSSDNVLRLGLTPKVVAVAEALEATDQSLVPEVLPRLPGPLQRYEVPGAPFVVTRLHGPVGVPASCRVEAGAWAVLLAVHGSASVLVGGARHALRRGEAAVLPPHAGPAEVEAEGVSFLCEAVPAATP